MNLLFNYILITANLLGYFFVGPNNAYSVLLSEEMILAQVDTLANTTLNHTFVKNDQENNFEYTISFSVIKSRNESLLSKEEIKLFEENCNCLVTQESNIEFTNFKGVKYLIEKEQSGIQLSGAVYFSDEIDGKRINIVSLALSDSKESLGKKIEPILNTLVLNL